MTIERYVIVLASQGDASFWRELLELVLAGASLDLDLVVVFKPEGLDSLRRHDSEYRAWRQLVDHQLAPVRVLRRPDTALDLPDWIVPVSECEAVSWRRDRTEIFA